jgi:hypothetical protein
VYTIIFNHRKPQTMFPITLQLTIKDLDQLADTLALLSGVSTATVALPAKTTKVAVDDAGKIDLKPDAPSTSVPAPAVEATPAMAALSYDDVKAAITKAVAEGKKDAVLAALGCFKDAEGKPCAKGPALQAADYAAFVAQVSA